MKESGPSIESYISDLKSFVKTLFEEGLQESVESCRKHGYPSPYTTPVPIDYWGDGSDITSTRDKLFEIKCKAKVKLAYFFATKLKDQIDYYDLICAAMSNITRDDVEKYFINEVLRYTESSSLRDLYAERLYKLNQNLSKREEHGISDAAIPLIKGYGMLYRKGNLFEFGGCDVKIDNIGYNSEGGRDLFVDLSFKEVFDDMYHVYPLYEVKIRLYGVTKFDYNEEKNNNCERLDITVGKRFPSDNQITVDVCSWSYYSTILSCECKSIEILSVNVSVEKDPYEDKMMHLIEITNNTGKDISIKFNKNCSPYDIYYSPWGTEFYVPNIKTKEIIIPHEETLVLSKECPRAEHMYYQNIHPDAHVHPANLIEFCRVGDTILSKRQLFNDLSWTTDNTNDIPTADRDRYPISVRHSVSITELLQD